MFLVINASKGRYDRPINIYKPTEFNTVKEASDYLIDILLGWLDFYTQDEKLLERLNYDYDKYRKILRRRNIEKINNQIKDGEYHIPYDKYDSYEFDYDEYDNLIMITKGCPSDNEYRGETYQVVEI